MTTSLQCQSWERTDDGGIVTRFQYAEGHHQITASPKEMAGPGWKAAIYGREMVCVYHGSMLHHTVLGPGSGLIS